MIPRPLILLTLLLACMASESRAGRGAGELSLDRSSVLALLDAGMPRAVPFTLPGPTQVALRMEPPDRVEFREGGVEARIRVELEPLGYSSAVSVRYVPGLDPLDGTVRLEAASAIPDVVPSIPLDLASVLPPVSLPRALDWTVPGLSTEPFRVRCHVQGIRIREDRMVIELGLLTRRISPRARGGPGAEEGNRIGRGAEGAGTAVPGAFSERPPKRRADAYAGLALSDPTTPETRILSGRAVWPLPSVGRAGGGRSRGK